VTHRLVGLPAPDFTLLDQDGIAVSVESLRGAEALLVFIPYAFSPVCTYEIEQLRDAKDLSATNARIIVIDCDSTFVNQEWAYQNKFEGTLLSDFWPHGVVSRKYRVFDEELGRAKRCSFHIDADGIVDWALESPKGDARDLTEYRKVLGLIG